MDPIFNLPGVAAVLAPFLMIVGIVWVRSKAQVEEKRIAATAAAENSSAGNTAANRRIGELEERVRVLERIVTDRGFDVAHQIEALRSARGEETMADIQPRAKGLV